MVMEITGTVVGASHTLGQALIIAAGGGGEAPPPEQGVCESRASLACTGVGINRVLPESLVPGMDIEHMIQCAPCYAYSRERLTRTLLRLGKLTAGTAT